MSDIKLTLNPIPAAPDAAEAVAQQEAPVEETAPAADAE